MEKIIVSCLESRVEANRSIYARFLLGPFTDDHALTIATALRRALLSKVKSTGVTAIHIQGITHEFSTIVGVRESVLDLALNFQQIVFRSQIENQSQILQKRQGLPRLLHGTPRTQSIEQKSFTSYPTTSHKNGNEMQGIQNQSQKADFFSQLTKYGNTPFLLKQKRLHFCNKVGTHFVTQPITKNTELLSDTTQIGYLQMRGPAVIYANDLKLPLGIKCVDPTQYIATLSTEGLLVVKFLIGKKKVLFDHDLARKKPSVLFSKGIRAKAELAQKRSLRLQNRLNTDKSKVTQKRDEFFPKSEIEYRYIQNGVLQSSLRQRAPAALFDRKNYTITQEQARESQDKRNGNPNTNQLKVPAFVFDNHFKSSNLTTLLRDKAQTTGTAVSLQETDSGNSVLPTSGKQLRLNKGGEPQIGSSSTNFLRNTIFLDPTLDSVSQVNYIIEKDDLSNQPRERILLELWTDGSIHPRQAIHQASLSLMSTFSIFRKMLNLYSW